MKGFYCHNSTFFDQGTQKNKGACTCKGFARPAIYQQCYCMSLDVSRCPGVKGHCCLNSSLFLSGRPKQKKVGNLCFVHRKKAKYLPILLFASRLERTPAAALTADGTVVCHVYSRAPQSTLEHPKPHDRTCQDKSTSQNSTS